MAELFEQMISPEVINQAWRVLRSDHAVWEPGLRREEMERDLPLHLLRLVADLHSGNYRPAPLRRFPIAKADGRRRVLSALTLRDKLIQKAAQIVLEPDAERLFHHDSFGYRPRRSVEMALRRARERITCGLDWLVDADIRSFFDSIPIKPLRKHLHVFDQAMESKKVPFVRYADDFLLFSATKEEARRALDYAGRIMKDLDLELNMDKTQITRSGPHVTFLGERLPRVDGVVRKRNRS